MLVCGYVLGSVVNTDVNIDGIEGVEDVEGVGGIKNVRSVDGVDMFMLIGWFWILVVEVKKKNKRKEQSRCLWARRKCTKQLCIIHRSNNPLSQAFQGN